MLASWSIGCSKSGLETKDSTPVCRSMSKAGASFPPVIAYDRVSPSTSSALRFAAMSWFSSASKVFALVNTGASFTLLMVMVALEVTTAPSPSSMEKVKLSGPLSLAFGVYWKDPFGFIVTLPLVACASKANVSSELSISVAVSWPLNTPSSSTVTSRASGTGASLTEAMSMVTPAVSEFPSGSVIV